MMEEIHQVLVKLLDGRHRAINFSAPAISVESLKRCIHQITSIPSRHQLLTSDGRYLHDDQTLIFDGAHNFPKVVHLSLRLRGGKGGFGSLLRGAATKAGQKKTNNFDACRDMSGRRLRHVNAEKKLEEWRAEAEERRLEKVAEEFIKKKAKAVKKGGTSGDAEKYVEKYRQDSVKCMEKVEKSVRESLKGFVNSKRKIGDANVSEAKKTKIWLGKRKLDGDSDSDYMDEDSSDDSEDEEIEKSSIIDNSNISDSSKEVEGCSDSATDGKLDGNSSAGASSVSNSEIDETVVRGSTTSCKSLDDDSVLDEWNAADGLAVEIHEKVAEDRGVTSGYAADVSRGESVFDEKEEIEKTESSNMIEIVPPGISIMGKGEASESKATIIETSCNSESSPEAPAVICTDISDVGKPLNFDKFGSAAEMEVLGMDRLKSELQARGLKCGGTLPERAARLYLLKTTPLEKLPKKLLAKK